MATNKLPQFQSEGKHIKSVHGSSFITVEQQRITLLNLWQYEQMEHTFLQVFLFSISQSLKISKFTVLKLLEFRVRYYYVVVRLSSGRSVRQNFQTLEHWKSEQFSNIYFPFEFWTFTYFWKVITMSIKRLTKLKQGNFEQVIVFEVFFSSLTGDWLKTPSRQMHKTSVSCSRKPLSKDV